LSSAHVLTSRGVTRILQNEFKEAKSDLEESLRQQEDDAETLAALAVAGDSGVSKRFEVEELWRYKLCNGLDRYTDSTFHIAK